ncbi:glycosyltransferase family 2 protein [Pseudaestuariivita atlantica]|uniref:Uncharacterized protein n=1 Tax=Pseudaestuariivita atlantica TaxID=1317121 RepID=A0A0L1JRT3_9RHOB|nr:hypothetical protein [Pseudaestuariivita atlantica]KNG94450.1 hypothetical protein ATO11_08090 [Pseudaestuariivita atlantica]
MRYSNLPDFLARGRDVLAKGPVALIFAEDAVEIDTTLRHHQQLGFKAVVAFMPDAFDLAPDLVESCHRVTLDTLAENAVIDTVNAVIPVADGQWLYYCYNAEYLFHPFCEHRTVGEMLAFHAEERRDAMLTYVIDLYAGDLDRWPDAVSLDDAWLDKAGYYAQAREDPDDGWKPRDRQLDFHGGLRWRFEEHVPWERRKIDRIALFRAKTGLKLREDHTFSDEEYNTYACPWHNNMTAALASFRTAKALRKNPGSRFEIENFRWHNSVPFDWHSRQLLDLGLMEPGQWF